MNSLGRGRFLDERILGIGGHITTACGNAHSGLPPRIQAPHARVGTLHCQSRCPKPSQRTLGCVPSLLPRPRVSCLYPCVDGSQQRTNPRHSPPGGIGLQPSAWERRSTSRNPASPRSLTSATKMMSGRVVTGLPSRMSVSSRACSPAGVFGHSASRKHTSWSRSDSSASLIRISDTE